MEDAPEIMVCSDPDDEDLCCVVVVAGRGLTEKEAGQLAEEMAAEARIAVFEMSEAGTVH